MCASTYFVPPFLKDLKNDTWRKINELIIWIFLNKIQLTNFTKVLFCLFLFFVVCIFLCLTIISFSLLSEEISLWESTVSVCVESHCFCSTTVSSIHLHFFCFLFFRFSVILKIRITLSSLSVSSSPPFFFSSFLVDHTNLLFYHFAKVFVFLLDNNEEEYL